MQIVGRAHAATRNAIYTAVRQAGARIENGHIVWDETPAEN
jgi:hypothetical protein